MRGITGPRNRTNLGSNRGHEPGSSLAIKHLADCRTGEKVPGSLAAPAHTHPHATACRCMSFRWQQPSDLLRRRPRPVCLTRLALRSTGTRASLAASVLQHGQPRFTGSLPCGLGQPPRGGVGSVSRYWPLHPPLQERRRFSNGGVEDLVGEIFVERLSGQKGLYGFAAGLGVPKAGREDHAPCSNYRLPSMERNSRAYHDIFAAIQWSEAACHRRHLPREVVRSVDELVPLA